MVEHGVVYCVCSYQIFSLSVVVALDKKNEKKKRSNLAQQESEECNGSILQLMNLIVIKLINGQYSKHMPYILPLSHK